MRWFETSLTKLLDIKFEDLRFFIFSTVRTEDGMWDDRRKESPRTIISVSDEPIVDANSYVL